VKKGSRVSWLYRGVRTYGVGGLSATVKGPSGGTIKRVGTKEDPVVRIKSESTGNPVLKRASQLRSAPKRK
jgi:hypothetical protein